MTLTFPEPESYLAIYSIVVFLFSTFFISLEILPCKTRYSDSKRNVIFQMLGFILLIFSIFFVGLRPVSDSFGDMVVYDAIYSDLSQYGESQLLSSDYIFQLYIRFFVLLGLSSDIFFFISFFLYVFLPTIVFIKLLGKFWFWGILLFLTSISFWGYGVNGIRQGLATSLFLLVFASRNVFFTILILFFSVGLHASMIIPSVMYIISFLFLKCRVKSLMLIWFVSVVFSYFGGKEMLAYSSSFISSERFLSYVQNPERYRLDFVLYSAIPIIFGGFFIEKIGLRDVFYKRILTTYILINIVWVFLIYMSFSNRLAYLSWFIMPLILIYPLLKIDFKFKKSALVITLFFYSSFTFVMNVLLYKG